MNIVMASGDQYSRLAITTLKSLFLNSRNADEITIYYVGDSLMEESQSQLIDLAEENGGKIHFITMPEKFRDFNGSNRNGQIVFCYCFFQELLPESVEKVLLLEADQIVLGDLEELYETDISDYYIAAASDMQSSLYKKKIGLKPSSPYVNCGMVLYNLKKWRIDHMTAKIAEVLRSNKHMLFYDVQDVLNYTLEGGIKVLPSKYNGTTAIFLFDYQDMIRYRRPSDRCSKEDFEEGKKNPVIVHFTKNQIIQPRPWIEGCTHPYREYYMNVRSQTVMSDTPLWEYHPGMLNKLGNFLYTKVSKHFAAAVLGIVHAYLYPAFLYKFIIKAK